MIDEQYIFPTIGGEGNKPAPAAPVNYKTLSPDQRKDWNDFLDYLDSKKIGGSTELDKRDQSLGLKYLNEYRKQNPKTSITADLIPSIQYEQYLLRKGDSFPTITPEQLKYMRSGLNPAYMNRPVSDVDGWLGSITSKSYYPTAHRGTNNAGSYDFGTNIEDYVNSIQNPQLAEKYRTKNQILPTATPPAENNKTNTNAFGDQGLGADITNDPAIRRVKQFYSEYMNSPNYKARLQKMGYDHPDKVIKDRLKQIKATTAMNYPDWMNGTEWQDTENRIMYDPNQIKNFKMNKESVIAHEMGHASGAIGRGRLGSFQFKDPVSNLTLNTKERKILDDNNKLAQRETSSEKTADGLAQLMHDASASELKADIDALRYNLKKDKIYDTGTETFTKELLKKVKGNKKYMNDLPIKRLFGRLDDNALIYLMNSIAKTDPAANQNTGQV